ncbi:MAG: DNA polymerase subunit beta [Candidatus Tectimicrobiota bacterium]|nr:MAG: DNA polymerase subunit beta [Candidatus Tectomicrobia bacterium]
MPVRSLRSSVFTWPKAEEVDRAVRSRAQKVAQQRPEVIRIGYLGSYVRGDWGVGSDLDLLILVERSARPFAERASAWDTMELPVPADVWVYTPDEWQALAAQGSRFYREASRDAVWVYARQK